MRELYLQGVLIDLSEGETIGIDYALMKIDDLSTRNGSRSVEFALPKTTINRAFFEDTEQPATVSIKPYRRIDARLTVNGVDQQIRVCVLTSITDTYNVRLYDIQTDFYTIIKDRKLTDLDLAQYNHYHTFANVVTNRVASPAYVYPVIDNFVVTPNSEIDNASRVINPKYLYPAAKYEFMLAKIVGEAGYTLVNEITDVVNYPSAGLLVPLADKFIRDTNMGRYEGELTSVTPQGSGNVSTIYALISYDLVSSDYVYNYWQPTAESMELGTQQFVDEVTADIAVSYSVENTTAADLVFYYRIDVNTTTVYTYAQIIPALSTVTISLTKNDVAIQHATPNFAQVTTWFASNAPVSSLLINTASIIYSNVRLLRQSHPDVFYNSTTMPLQTYVTLSTVMPDWEQAKLVKEYCKLTCAILKVDELAGTVTLFPFNKIIQNISRALDWSDKLDFSNSPECRYSFDNYGQNNNFKYAVDDTVTKPANTDYVLVIDDQTLQLEADIIEMEFAATESVERLEGLFIPNIKIVNADFSLDGVEPRVLVNRIVDLNNDSPVNDLVYDDGTTSTNVLINVPIPYFIDTAEDFNLGFGDNIFTKFYTAVGGMLQDMRIINADIRLNESDINQLDLMTPVYIKHFNAYFYINMISNYTPSENESTEVELIKLF